MNALINKGDTMRMMGLVHEIKDKQLLGKLERINTLNSLGLNVPGYYLIHDEATLREFKEELLPKYQRMSVRTYSKSDEFKEFKCPFYPNHLVKSFENESGKVTGIVDMIDELASKYYVIASPPIDPEKCLFAGNLITPEWGDEVVHIEFIKGPGTVRDVEKRGIALEVPRKGEIIFEGQRMHDLERVRDLALKFPNSGQVLEWSVYSENVGQLKQDVVFWEYRPLTNKE